MTDKQITVELSLIEWVYLTLGCIAQVKGNHVLKDRAERVSQEIDGQLSETAPDGSIERAFTCLMQHFQTGGMPATDRQMHEPYSLTLSVTDATYLMCGMMTQALNGKHLFAATIDAKLTAAINPTDGLAATEILRDEQRDVYPEIIGD